MSTKEHWYKPTHSFPLMGAEWSGTGHFCFRESAANDTKRISGEPDTLRYEIDRCDTVVTYEPSANGYARASDGTYAAAHYIGLASTKFPGATWKRRAAPLAPSVAWVDGVPVAIVMPVRTDGDKPPSVKEYPKCPKCEGGGGEKVCPECDGIGETECPHCGHETDCDECDGEGWVGQCAECGGDGRWKP